MGGEHGESVIYLDPPYYVKGEGLYENFYRHEHHVAIARRVGQLRVPWVVSYDAAPEILHLYKRRKSLRYSLSYSAGDRHRGAEVMFFSRSLVAPSVASPAGISSEAVDLMRQPTLAH